VIEHRSIDGVRRPVAVVVLCGVCPRRREVAWAWRDEAGVLRYDNMTSARARRTAWSDKGPTVAVMLAVPVAGRRRLEGWCRDHGGLVTADLVLDDDVPANATLRVPAYPVGRR
jgi:hypothetical protein